MRKQLFKEQKWAIVCVGLLKLALSVSTLGAQMVESEPTVPPSAVKSAPSLQPRQFAAVAHDSQHRQFLLFGGTYGSERFSDTWLLESSGWKVQSPRAHPNARISSAVTYDGAHNGFVLFGGRVTHAKPTTCSPGGTPQSLEKEDFCSDTWVFNSGNWTRKEPAKSPSPREGHAMVFDAARNQVVLFGGTAGGTASPLSDTWVWNGTTWKQVVPAHHPPGRFSHTMAYDPIHRQVILFGGDGGNKMLNDTWIWNGRDWEAAHIESTPPTFRTNAAMDYDATMRKMILFSGTAWTVKRNGLVAMDSWTWDGSRWAKLPASKFDLITNFTGLTAKQAGEGLLANGTPSYLWLPGK